MLRNTKKTELRDYIKVDELKSEDYITVKVDENGLNNLDVMADLLNSGFDIISTATLKNKIVYILKKKKIVTEYDPLPIALYLCDEKKCECCTKCGLTSDVTHAKNFKVDSRFMGKPRLYFEKGLEEFDDTIRVKPESEPKQIVIRTYTKNNSKLDRYLQDGWVVKFATYIKDGQTEYILEKSND